jgi:FkbM family methyltransferase
MTLLQNKKAEIARRGLMGYPVDSAEDALRIDGIAHLLGTLHGTMQIRLPGRDIVVPWDASLPAQLAYYLAIGDYEHHDLDLAAEFVRPGDTVMELGGGVGVTGVALGRASGCDIVVVEPNPALYDAIARTFRANGCGIHIVRAAAAGGQGTADFHVAENYWWSSLEPRDDAQTILVEQVPLADLLAAHRPTVLAVDIEGHERHLVGTPLPECLRCILMEIHTPDIGTAETGTIVSWLTDEGFRMKDVRSYTWAFERG